MKKHLYHRGETITFFCLLGNLALSLLKGLAGYFGSSKAMIADAFHSGSDTFATLVVYISLKISRKPADECHPYGHGKVEPLAAIFVGLTLLAAAALIGRDIIISVLENQIPTPSLIALAAAVGSIIVKEVMFRITYRTGSELNSEAMIANAWDHRSDAYSSIGVLIGIAGSMAGAYYGIAWLRFLDPLAGTVVAILIIKIAVMILIKAVGNLMDASLSEETIEHVKSLAHRVPGVIDISWVRGRVVGPEVQIDIAVQVDATKTVQEGHDIADMIKETLQHNSDHVSEVLVHINPHDNLHLKNEQLSTIRGNYLTD
ncbi:MAG: cation diffusion facilitator family transporter [Bacillota bacterium]|nr:cation diffusion facilitator family transporter [Bacillota bacterium]